MEGSQVRESSGAGILQGGLVCEGNGIGVLRTTHPQTVSSEIKDSKCLLALR